MSSQRLPRLVFGEGPSRTFSDVEDFYEFVRQQNPAVLRAATPGAPFSFKGSVVKFPTLQISTSVSDPCTITTQFSSKRFSLIVPLLGTGTVGVHSHRRDWNVEDNLIFNALAEDNIFTFKDLRSQVLFEIDADRLTRTFVNMHGIDANRSVIMASESSVESLTEKSRGLRSLLLSTLSLIDLTGQDVEHLTRIGFDDVIFRTLAELTLEGRSHTVAVRSHHAVKRSQRAVKLICELIAQSTGHPMTSTQMEEASGMTSRALSYAFNESYGCSPQEWQRNHFLDLARAEMLRGSGTASVKSISKQFGFVTSASFSTFYHRRFGEKPSETLNRPSSGRSK